MNIQSSTAVAQLGKFRAKLEASDAEGFKGQMTQLGINMVDLMMWLVIAALLLAAALQGIGYYQQAAWTYQAKADVASVRTYMEAQFTLRDNTYPTGSSTDPSSDIGTAVANGDLKLTGGNTVWAEVGYNNEPTSAWSAEVASPSLAEAGKPSLFQFGSMDDPASSYGYTGNNPVPVYPAAP